MVATVGEAWSTCTTYLIFNQHGSEISSPARSFSHSNPNLDEQCHCCLTKERSCSTTAGGQLVVLASKINFMHPYSASKVFRTKMSEKRVEPKFSASSYEERSVPVLRIFCLLPVTLT